MDSTAVPAPHVWGDQIEVGSTFEFPEYTVGEQEILRFAELWDPQWFHTDPHAAEDGPYGGLIASGVQTIAIFQRLCVQSAFRRWHVIAGRSLREVWFLRPLRPEATVSGHLRVTETVNDKHGRTLVVLEGELVGDGKTLLSSVSDVYLRSRTNLSRTSATPGPAPGRSTGGPTHQRAGGTTPGGGVLLAPDLHLLDRRGYRHRRDQVTAIVDPGGHTSETFGMFPVFVGKAGPARHFQLTLELCGAAIPSSVCSGAGRNDR